VGAWAIVQMDSHGRDDHQAVPREDTSFPNVFVPTRDGYREVPVPGTSIRPGTTERKSLRTKKYAHVLWRDEPRSAPGTGWPISGHLPRQLPATPVGWLNLVGPPGIDAVAQE
jgi:hypothetical protein